MLRQLTSSATTYEGVGAPLTSHAIDRIDLAYYTAADGDGQTTAAREPGIDVGGDPRSAAECGASLLHHGLLGTGVILPRQPLGLEFQGVEPILIHLDDLLPHAIADEQRPQAGEVLPGPDQRGPVGL